MPMKKKPRQIERDILRMMKRVENMEKILHTKSPNFAFRQLFK